MSTTKKQAVDGFNEQVDQLREDSKDQDIRVSLVTFNGNVYEHFWDQPVDTLENAKHKDFKPSGSTSFYDALGYGIQKLQETTDTQDENNAYLVISISDGGENSSKFYVNGSLKEMVEGCQLSKRWTFTYMGCSEAVLAEVAQATSIPVSNMAVWANQTADAATRGMSGTRKRMKSYMTNRTKGTVSAECFYSADVGTAMNFSDVDESSVSINTFGNTSGTFADTSNSVVESTDTDTDSVKDYNFDKLRESQLPEYTCRKAEERGTIFGCSSMVEFKGKEGEETSDFEYPNAQMWNSMRRGGPDVYRKMTSKLS